jgi:hypothetical protein
MVMMVGELYILIEIIIFGNYFLGAILFQSAHTAPSGTAIALLYNSVRAGSVGHFKHHLLSIIQLPFNGRRWRFEASPRTHARRAPRCSSMSTI